MALAETLCRIFLTVICLLNLGSLALATASWDQNDIEIQQGEDISITCTVSGLDPMGVLRIERTDADDKTTTILDNDSIKPMYDDTGRYAIEYDMDMAQQRGTAKLTYTGIRGEDAGTIGCLRLGDQQNKAFINIKVLVPVKDVYAIAVLGEGNERKEADGATISMTEEEHMGVICVAVVDGTNEAPTMQLTIDGENVMDQFVRTETPQPNASSRSRRQNNHELVTQQNEVRLAYVTRAPDYNFNAKELTCTATNPGMPSKSTTVYMDVEFRPEVQCTKYNYHAQLESTVTITCNVWANPGSTVKWSHGKAVDGALVIDPVNNSGTFSISDEVVREDHTKVSLTITDVNSSHFTNYYLHVSNDIGSDDITISLEEGAEPPPQPPQKPDPQGVKGGGSGADSLCSAMTFTIVLASSLTFLQYVIPRVHIL